MLRFVMSQSEGKRISVGDRIEVEVGVIAHGGHFIAHHDGMTIFVRGADTGEQVLIEIDDVTKKIARAHVVHVGNASPNRVKPRCQYFIDFACGGCDFQHLTLEHQSQLKVKVVADSLKRIGGIEITPRLVTVPGDGFDWRMRMDFDVSPGGRLALHPSRSNQITEVTQCAIARQEIDIAGINMQLEQRRDIWGSRIRVGVDDDQAYKTTIAKGVRLNHTVFDEKFEVSLESFWQPHRLAAEMLVRELQQALNASTGERILDLYGGVGLFTAFIRKMVGETGRVTLVESDAHSIKDARRKFKSDRRVEVVQSDVKRFLTSLQDIDRIVVDPPRTGLGAEVVKEILRLAPKQILYIACDPATQARDAKQIVAAGYSLESIHVLDLFPNTEHVEIVANFIPAP